MFSMLNREMNVMWMPMPKLPIVKVEMKMRVMLMSKVKVTVMVIAVAKLKVQMLMMLMMKIRFKANYDVTDCDNSKDEEVIFEYSYRPIRFNVSVCCTGDISSLHRGEDAGDTNENGNGDCVGDADAEGSVTDPSVSTMSCFFFFCAMGSGGLSDFGVDANWFTSVREKHREGGGSQNKGIMMESSVHGGH